MVSFVLSISLIPYTWGQAIWNCEGYFIYNITIYKTNEINLSETISWLIYSGWSQIKFHWGFNGSFFLCEIYEIWHCRRLMSVILSLSVWYQSESDTKLSYSKLKHDYPMLGELFISFALLSVLFSHTIWQGKYSLHIWSSFTRSLFMWIIIPIK